MSEVSDKRRGFFEFLFGEHEGYLAIALAEVRTGKFREYFYPYPDDLNKALDIIDRSVTTHDIYYCPHLLTAPKLVKENVQECPAIWADIDTAPIDKLKLRPTLITQTSEGHTQGLWILKETAHSTEAEAVAKRLAKFHANDGVDNCWNLGRLMRVPLTYNHKYAAEGKTQTVKVIEAETSRKYSIEDFDVYPLLDEGETEHTELPFPEKLPDKEPGDIFEEHKVHLNPRVYQLYSEEPTVDWSAALWNMNCILFEAEVPIEDVFIIAKNAACNKYDRDNKPDKFLWKEVVRAWDHVQKRNSAPTPKETHNKAHDIPLLSDEEREEAGKVQDIVHDYVEWARSLGDAAWQYHQAGAFIVLSALLAGPVRLPTSFGTILPNLWFMILADTTLTRKSTAMDIPMDLLDEIDPDIKFANDGSIEGLLTSLSMRPGRPSIFLRDEFTGLMEQVSKREYYAGMLETLTKLYDGRPQKRQLRKELIEIRDPILIIFAGGIKEKMLSLMTQEHVTSGFIPRFLFITAESDITRLKPLGPPTEKDTSKRDELLNRFNEIREHYWKPRDSNRERNGQVQLNTAWHAELTDEAWVRYNKAETDLLQAGLNSPIKQLLTPTHDRLAKSALKAAVLLAAAEKLGDKVVVTEAHICRALYFVEQWRYHTLEVISNLGRGTHERQLEKILHTVEDKPGILRSTIMQWYHLTSRDADNALGTLEQRGLIRRQKSGRTEKLFAEAKG